MGNPRCIGGISAVALAGALTLVAPVLAASLTPGSILVAEPGAMKVREYSRGGALLQTFSIPIADGRGFADLRDLAVDAAGNVQIYNGTFEPALTTLDPRSGSCTHRWFPGWDTINNVSYGGLATMGGRVYATDMTTYGEPGSEARGIVVFDRVAGTAARPVENTDYQDLAIGLDRKLYVLPYGSSTVDVYSPSTMALSRTVSLHGSADPRGIAVDRDGTLFVADWDGSIAKFDANGNLVSKVQTGAFNLNDIDVAEDGTIVAGGRFGDVVTTTTALGPVSVFTLPGGPSIHVAIVPTPSPARQRDFDADGHADLVWYSNLYGGAAIWLMNGLVPAGGAWVGPTVDWWVTHTADFDGDGASDLVVYNRHDGTTGVRLMDGANQTASASLLRDANVRVTHSGDFDGDGRADLLWRDIYTGTTALWLMDGIAPASTTWLLRDPAWAPTHVADFDGDGLDDILWRNEGSGDTAIWRMNGAAYQSGAIVLSNPSWRVVLIGDFDGDGRADLVWRNAATGETALWLMRGTAMASGTIVVADPNWVPTHVADLDGDGKSDLIWRNIATGATNAWRMNGLAMTEGTAITVPGAEIVASGDYDGDGRDDLVWYESASATTSMRLMNGLAVKASAPLLQSGDWHVQP